MSSSSAVFQPLTFPNGTTIPNRIGKAAMEERLADMSSLSTFGAPSEELLRLYKAWGEGGAGLIITGNVMVDRRGVTGPAGVQLVNEAHLDRFAQWAKVAREPSGAQILMQINHPGRQMQNDLQQETIAPSAVPMDLGFLGNKKFSVPRAMTEQEINEMIAKYATTARLAKRAGFSGVQIHAAHGYLASQFLSPLVNKRDDQWGGSIDNRMRFLVSIVSAVRAAVASPQFTVAVKLNSADFQRGGFSTEEAAYVVKQLRALSVDLVELSGGSYEAPAMQGSARDGRTLAREAYFLEFAKEMLAVAGGMPLMVTGGIRRLAVAEEVLRQGVSVVGMATALSLMPDLPNRWRQLCETGAAGEGDPAPTLAPVTWSHKSLASIANMAMVEHQLHQLAQGKAPEPDKWPSVALAGSQYRNYCNTKKYVTYSEELSKEEEINNGHSKEQTIC